jgi:hypothetical protein
MTVTVDPRKHACSADGARSANGEIIARAEHSLYPYHEYELFCAQFVSRCDAIRDVGARTQMRDIIRDTRMRVSDKTTRLREIGLSPMDITHVLTDEQGARTGEIRGSLDIDLAPLRAALDGPRADLVAWVRGTIADYVEQTDPRAPAPLVPQFIAPCFGSTLPARHSAEKQSQSHRSDDDGGATSCNGEKLRIRTPLSRLIDILVSDLRSPIKRAYIFTHSSSPESRAPFADFTQRASEILIVKKYEIKT